jgi:hypothetical protein
MIRYVLEDPSILTALDNNWSWLFFIKFARRYSYREGKYDENKQTFRFPTPAFQALVGFRFALGRHINGYYGLSGGTGRTG